MPVLSDVLNATKNGQEILNMAIPLGFSAALLYNSFSKNTLCIIVDFDAANKQKDFDADLQSYYLKYQIAKKFNYKTVVLQIEDLTQDDEADIKKNSINLPINDMSVLTTIFGDPSKFTINTIEEDKIYKLCFESDERVFAGTTNSNSSFEKNDYNPATFPLYETSRQVPSDEKKVSVEEKAGTTLRPEDKQQISREHKIKTPSKPGKQVKISTNENKKSFSKKLFR